MKRILDDLFVKHMEEGNYVIAADIGFFPKARKHINFIDVGNDESCVGSVVEGLLSQGKHVFLYDVCGYVMKNSYASLFARNNVYHPKKGTLTVFGWGSGFAYDGCLLGHYPLDDCIIADLLGLIVYKPSTMEDMRSIKYYRHDAYIRMFDASKFIFKRKPYNTEADVVLVSEGWILGLMQKYAINGFWGEKTVCVVSEEDYEYDCDHAIFLSDQIEDRTFSHFEVSLHPMNPNYNSTIATKYKDMNSCVDEWFLRYLREHTI
jgi:hypothetical protein